jgi:exopolysaccharide biosynthesis polyprenyl glycosylphosphotransferase
MLYQNLHVFGGALRFIDAVILVLAVLVLPWLGVPQNTWDAVPERTVVVLAFGLGVAFFVIAGKLRIYQARRAQALRHELGPLFEASLFATGLSCLFVEMMTDGLPARAYTAVGIAAVALLLGTRAVVRFVVRRVRRKGRDYRTWLVIGKNQRSAQVVSDILAHPHYGIRIAGTMDVPSEGRTPGTNPASAFAVAPLESIADFAPLDVSSLREALSRHAIDEVVVTLPLRSFYDDVQKVIAICGEAGVSVKCPTHTFDVGTKTAVEQVGDIPLVTHYSGPANAASLMVKRVIDIFGALVGLIVLLPFFIVVGILIKLGSRGPVFFRQTRVGMNSRHFSMLKFRSMVTGAADQRDELLHSNEADGPVFKIKNDPRVTSIGRFLRKYHLDELPQLWNVLVGDMSLVGPRPLPVKEADGSEWWHRRRLSMPPGMTCFWQVTGDNRHNRMSFDRWVQLDLEYIDRWSLRLDFRLLVATVRTVFQGRGW